MRQIKGDSEEPEIGIEWENGVYLSSKPSRIDFQGIREDYGGAKLEKDREDIRLEQEDYFTQLHKLANNPHCSEDIRELLSEIMRVEFCTDKMDKFHQNLSAGIYDEDSEMKVFPVTVSKDMESVLSVRGIDLEDAIEVATNEWNVEAIILKQLESEGRLATAEEQKTLSLYARWGGIPQAFDGKNNDWSKEYAELKELLTEDEYVAARATVNNALYTSPVICSCINQALVNFGFRDENLLEPSMGIGDFFGSMPTPMQRANLYGA